MWWPMATVLALAETTRMKITFTMDFNRDMSEEEVTQFVGEVLAQAEEDQEGNGRNLHDFRFTLNDDDEEVIIDHA